MEWTHWYKVEITLTQHFELTFLRTIFIKRKMKKKLGAYYSAEVSILYKSIISFFILLDFLILKMKNYDSKYNSLLEWN